MGWLVDMSEVSKVFSGGAKTVALGWAAPRLCWLWPPV
jgi:hypothetical protein